MLESISTHVQTTWKDVLEGHSTLGEKAELVTEGLLAATATIALLKFGVARGFAPVSTLAGAEQRLLAASSIQLTEEKAFSASTALSQPLRVAETLKGLLPEIDSSALSALPTVTTTATHEQIPGTTFNITQLLKKVTLAPEVPAISVAVENVSPASANLLRSKHPLTPEQIKVLFDETIIKGRAGNWAAARPSAEYLTQIIDSQSKDHVRAHYWLSLAQGNLGEYAPAIKGMEDVLERTAGSRSVNGVAIRQKMFHNYGDILRKSGDESAAQVKDAHALGLRAELPDMAMFKERLMVPPSYMPSDQGSEAANMFSFDNFYKRKFPNGFYDHGTIFHFADSKPVVTVLDRDHDPVLRELIDRVDENFGHLRSHPEASAAAIGEYTRRLFGKADADSYIAWRDSNAGQEFFLGEFSRTGCGACNQHSITFKALAETQGHEVTILNGFYDDKFAHAFNTVRINGEDKLWDITLNNVNKKFLQGTDANAEYRSPFVDGLWDFNHEWDK